MKKTRMAYQPRGNIAKILLLAKRRTTSSIIEIDYFSRIVFALLSYSSYITVVQKSLTKSFIRVYAASEPDILAIPSYTRILSFVAQEVFFCV